MGENTKTGKTPAPTRLWPWVLLLLLIGLAIRLVGVNKSLSYDELFSLDAASRSIGGLLAYISTHDTHPPLYYLLLHFWILGGESELWVRLPSILLNLASCYVAYLIACRFIKPKLAIWALVLTVTSPVLVDTAQLARNYSLMTFCAALSTYAAIGILQERGRKYWVLYILSAVAGIYTFYYFAYVLAAQTLAFIVCALRQPRKVGAFIVAQFVSVAAFLPWMPSFAAQAKFMGSLDKPAPVSLGRVYESLFGLTMAVDFTRPIFHRIGHPRLIAAAMLIVLAVLLLRCRSYAARTHSGAAKLGIFAILLAGVLIAGALGASVLVGLDILHAIPGLLGIFFAGILIYAAFSGNALRSAVGDNLFAGYCFLAVLIAAVLAVAVVGSIAFRVFFNPRYLAFLAIFGGALITMLASHLRPGYRAIGLIVVALMQLTGLPPIYSQLEDVKGAGAYLSSQAKPGSCVLAIASYQSKFLGHYARLRSGIPVRGLPEDIKGLRKDDMLNENDLPIAGRYISGYSTVWVVWSHVVRGDRDRGKPLLQEWLTDNGYHSAADRSFSGIEVQRYDR